MNAKEAYLSKPWLKYYPKGVPSEVDVPDISVPEIFDRQVDKYANKTALILPTLLVWRSATAAPVLFAGMP